MTECGWCGSAIEATGRRGRPSRYCRRSCRQRAYEARKQAELDAALAAATAKPSRRGRRGDAVGLLAEIEQDLLVVSQARALHSSVGPTVGLAALARVKQCLDRHEMLLTIEAERQSVNAADIAALFGRTVDEQQAWLTGALHRHSDE